MQTTPTEPQPSETKDWLEVVRKNVSGLRFGSVLITVHDGRVTQIESVEKTRFVPTPPAAPPRK